MFTENFINWVTSLDATERVLVPAKRNESLAEFITNRSSK